MLRLFVRVCFEEDLAQLVNMPLSFNAYTETHINKVGMI